MIIARQQAKQDAIMDIGGWLRSLGLEKYEAVLRDNEIDEAVLRSLRRIIFVSWVFRLAPGSIC
jgi:hypothetical protein